MRGKPNTRLYALYANEIIKLHGAISMRTANRRIKKVLEKNGIKNRNFITRIEYAEFYGFDFRTLELSLIG